MLLFISLVVAYDEKSRRIFPCREKYVTSCLVRDEERKGGG